MTTSLPFSNIAREALGAPLFDYMIGRAPDSHAAPDEDVNEAAFGRYRLLPRLTVDAKAPDLSTTIFGRSMSAPLFIGAFAGDRVFHEEGLLPVARVAARLGIDMVVSEETVTPLEQITKAHAGVWLQLRAAGSEERIETIVRKAAEIGVAGIVMTLMAPSHPRPGQRPGGFDIGRELSQRGWPTIGTTLDGSMLPGVAPLAAFPRWGIAKLKRISNLTESLDLPLVIKGVLHPSDVTPLADCGISGLIASNIGLRQSARWALALDQLPALAVAGADRLPLLLDGGVRHASDCLIAHLLGADATVVTRPIITALTGGGETSVEQWLTALLDGLYAMTAWMGSDHPARLQPDQLIIG